MSVTLQTKGLIFPITLTSGKADLTEGTDLIKASIKSIISWPLYTREYIDNFGSRIHEALEEPNDGILLSLVKGFIINPIQKFEKRVMLTKLNFQRLNESRLIVTLTYNIRDLNIEDSFSHTFYSN